MKTFLTLFVLFFSSSVVADDISDFQIEGMSVGDSLLDYLSKDEIIIKTEFEKEQGNNKEMGIIYLNNNKGNFKNYRRIKIAYETKDKNYQILLITGFVDINKDIDKCIIKKQEITEELQNLFNNLEIENSGWREHAFDSSSSTNSSIFNFPINSEYAPFIRVICYDWSKTSGYSDQLRVELVSSKYYEWLYTLHQSQN